MLHDKLVSVDSHANAQQCLLINNMCVHIYIYIYTYILKIKLTLKAPLNHEIFIVLSIQKCIAISQYIINYNIYIYIYIYFFFHHTTCGSTCDTLASSAAIQGDNTVSVAQGNTATPGATEQLLPPDRVFKKNLCIHKIN